MSALGTKIVESLGFNALGFTEEVLEVLGRSRLENAGRLPRAHHVGFVLFCVEELAPRAVIATKAVYLPDLRFALRSAVAKGRGVSPDDPSLKNPNKFSGWFQEQSASPEGAVESDPKEAADAEEELRLILASAKANRPNYGPHDVSDLILGTFNSVTLNQIYSRFGLTEEVMRENLPKAQKAIALYESQKPEGASRTNSSSTERRQESGKTEPSPTQYGIEDVTLKKAMNVSMNRSLTPQKQVTKSKDRQKQQEAILERFALDLVALHADGHLDPVIGRDSEIERVLRILSRQRKNNCCLVGPPGVGKSAIAEGVAARIAAGYLPPALTDLKELWSLNVGALLAGTQYRGTFEEQLTDLLDEVVARKGRMVLFVDEIHMLIGAGKSENNNIDAANLLKPALARGVACLGATTAEEYEILKKDAAFERRFQVVKLNEPSVPEAIEMLRGIAPVMEQHHRVSVAPGAIEAAVKLTHAKIKHRRLPDKAIDVLDEACAAMAPSTSSSISNATIATPQVFEKDVAAIVHDWHAETGSSIARLFNWAKETLRSRL